MRGATNNHSSTGITVVSPNGNKRTVLEDFSSTPAGKIAKFERNICSNNSWMLISGLGEYLHRYKNIIFLIKIFKKKLF